MSFEELSDMVERGVGLLRQGREVLAEVRSAVADGKTAINTASVDDLLAQLDREEQETKNAVASARDAIAEYRRG